MDKVDSIISSITKMVTKLEKTATFHFEKSIIHGRLASAADKLRAEHDQEAHRAMAIKAKVEALVSV